MKTMTIDKFKKSMERIGLSQNIVTNQINDYLKSDDSKVPFEKYGDTHFSLVYNCLDAYIKNKKKEDISKKIFLCSLKNKFKQDKTLLMAQVGLSSVFSIFTIINTALLGQNNMSFFDCLALTILFFTILFLTMAIQCMYYDKSSDFYLSVIDLLEEQFQSVEKI